MLQLYTADGTCRKILKLCGSNPVYNIVCHFNGTAVSQTMKTCHPTYPTQ
jgi:hypothetical protein